MTKTLSLDPIFASYAQLAGAISEQFGSNCQASVYDLRENPGGLVAVAGSLTPQKLRAPLPVEVQRQIRLTRRAGQERQFYTSSAPQGLRLSSSVTLLYDAGCNLVGCICIDLCIESLISSIDVLQNFCNYSPSTLSTDPPEDSVIGLVDGFVIEALRDRATRPPNDRKSERLKIGAQLENKGVFLVKGAVELVASRLNISKYKLYSDIEQIRQSETVPDQGAPSDTGEPQDAKRGK